MEAQQIKRTTPKSRGFYVKMKLLQQQNGKHGRPQEKSCFFRYYKWLLWLSLTLYFFSPYLLTTTTTTNDDDSKKDNQNNIKPTFLSKTRVVSSSKSTFASRALIESTASDSRLQQPLHDQEGQSTLSLSLLLSFVVFFSGLFDCFLGFFLYLFFNKLQGYRRC